MAGVRLHIWTNALLISCGFQHTRNFGFQKKQGINHVNDSVGFVWSIFRIVILTKRGTYGLQVFKFRAVSVHFYVAVKYLRFNQFW